MIYMLLISHLLGDYVFQFDRLARWKFRSIWGVVAHGGIVTATTVACAALVEATWWPFALLIGLSHTLIDVVRARLIPAKQPVRAWLSLVADQVSHVAIIVGVALATDAPSLPAPPPSLRGGMDVRVWLYLIGYLVLLQPAWVLVRFTARGMWGEEVPPLGRGEKYAPMVERVLIATAVWLGQFYLVPLVLLPRRLALLQTQRNGMVVLVQLTTHWGETCLGVGLALLIGLGLRLLSLGVVWM
mgnify:CR=1 FL=1